MTEPSQTTPRSGSTLWVGLLIAVLGFASNFLYWLPLPQAIIPWINVIVPLIGLVLVFAGLRRYWPGAHGWRRVVSILVVVVSVAVMALSVFAFVSARNVPRSSGAPQVGQKVPDFVLPDSSGKTVSLSQLLSEPLANSARPRAVLLIFYRGYW